MRNVQISAASRERDMMNAGLESVFLCRQIPLVRHLTFELELSHVSLQETDPMGQLQIGSVFG